MPRGDEPPGALSLRRSESASPIRLPGQATPLAAEDKTGPHGSRSSRRPTSLGSRLMVARLPTCCQLFAVTPVSRRWQGRQPTTDVGAWRPYTVPDDPPAPARRALLESVDGCPLGTTLPRHSEVGPRRLPPLGATVLQKVPSP
jgi:hypothetical protein